MQSSFEKAAVSPLDPSLPEFQAGNTNTHIAAVAYKRFEEAMDSLPTPMAVICKTANRASAVLAAYKVNTVNIFIYVVVRSPSVTHNA